MSRQAEIFDALAVLSIVLNQPQDEKRLEFYSEALNEFDFEIVLRVIKNFAFKPDRGGYFPQLASIIDRIKGQAQDTLEMAVIIANEIVSAIPNFPRNSSIEIKEHLGAKFEIIERFGGWAMLSAIENEDLSNTRAQLRELAKAYLNRNKIEGQELINFKSKPKAELRLINFENFTIVPKA